MWIDETGRAFFIKKKAVEVKAWLTVGEEPLAAVIPFYMYVMV